MRLFLAIELPQEVKQYLDQVRQTFEQIGDLREELSFVKRENWHVTLKFLGEVADADVPALVSELSHIPVEPMKLCARFLTYFQNRNPRVIAVAVDGEVERLAKLFAQIEDACERLAFAKEQR